MRHVIASRVAVLLLAAAVGCTSTSATRMHFTPRGATADAVTAFDAEFRRTCTVGDCRRQAVELQLPSGERLRGELAFHARGGGVGGSIEFGSGGWQAGLGASGAVGRTAEQGVMNLVGDRATRLGCEILFTTGTRHGNGVCRAANGDVFDVRF